MIKLNDYLYDGETIFRILQKYIDDLEEKALATHNQIDLVHCSFLETIYELLEHNEFLTSQSQRIREFYKYMVVEYPYLAFTFKGRIKSIIRAEEKFNRYIVDFIYDYYKMYHHFPALQEIKEKLSCFRDLLAYRIVISLPKCHLQEGQDREEEEIKLLYEIANKLPSFLENQGFTIVKANTTGRECSELLDMSLWTTYRDYVYEPTAAGYRSLHLTLFDDMAKCHVEVQLRTKSMDDSAEIGVSNHLRYVESQEQQKNRRVEIPEGECIYFDEAYERVVSLEDIELSKLDVNMFTAVNNSLINDGCGLFRGRQILPFEHLSRFQNGLVD
ncbi:guanosine polyphosphate pyrophosphohydrolase [Pseudobutyrivibrio sp.]